MKPLESTSPGTHGCRLVVEGQTNDAIALRLNIGTHTVEAHLTRPYQKTGQRGRTALARWWLQRD